MLSRPYALKGSGNLHSNSFYFGGRRLLRYVVKGDIVGYKLVGDWVCVCVDWGLNIL